MGCALPGLVVAVLRWGGLVKLKCLMFDGAWSSPHALIPHWWDIVCLLCVLDIGKDVS